MIHPYGSISWRIDLNNIEIWTDAGRMLQPLHIIDNNKLRITGEMIKMVKDKKLDFENLVHGMRQHQQKRQHQHEPSSSG